MTEFNSPSGPDLAKELAPERVPLAALATQRGHTSPALTRLLCDGAERHGPGKVAVAAFQSSV